jgi:hypothetical protein
VSQSLTHSHPIIRIHSQSPNNSHTHSPSIRGALAARRLDVPASSHCIIFHPRSFALVLIPHKSVADFARYMVDSIHEGLNMGANGTPYGDRLRFFDADDARLRNEDSVVGFTVPDGGVVMFVGSTEGGAW